MSKPTPCARTIKLLRDEGFQVDVVERRIPRCFISKDLFGMFDLVAVRSDLPGVLGVQATSGSNHAARVKKVKGNPILSVWLQAGNRAEVISWKKDREGCWVARREVVLPAAGQAERDNTNGMGEG